MFAATAAAAAANGATAALRAERLARRVRNVGRHEAAYNIAGLTHGTLRLESPADNPRRNRGTRTLHHILGRRRRNLAYPRPLPALGRSSATLLLSRRRDEQHRRRCPTNDLMGHTAEEYFLQEPTSLASHHNQMTASLLSLADDLPTWRSVRDFDANLGRRPAVPTCSRSDSRRRRSTSLNSSKRWARCVSMCVRSWTCSRVTRLPPLSTILST